ncbi:retrovirus-related pol polyprotein from transposon TNT 1-94 [Tanacetum coccineum]
MEIVENGNAPIVTKTVDGKETVIPPTSVEDKVQRRAEFKARSTLLMDLPKKIKLKFNTYKDAKTLMRAIKNKFRGNTATKKIQKNLLSRYENFVASSSKVLTNLMRASKANKNKPEMNIKLDDLFNNLKAYDQRARRFPKNTGRKLDMANKERIGFDKFKVECFNCHKRGHFAREYRAPKNQDSKNNEPTRRNVPVEETTLNALISQSDGFGYDWSDQAEEGYNVVPPPYTRNFMPPKLDLVYPILDDFVDVNESISESVVEKPIVETNEPKTARKENGALIIEDYVSESKEQDEPKFQTGYPQQDLKDKGVIDIGCSRHMIGNKSYLTDYEEINGGFVAFRGNSKGGKITGKGKIKTGKLDFKDVYFVKELKFNLFSVSQMCDKKKSVLFTDTECVVLSLDVKLTDESHVLLKVHRKDNMYSVDLKNVVPQGELRVKVIRCDNGTEFKNRVKNQFYEMMGIKREFSVARTPQQNGAEAVNTACYVQNRVLVIKPHNKTPYELFLGRKPALSFMRPFGCPVTILNTIDHLGKFDGKADEGFFVGYSTNSKAFRVFNSRTRIVEKNLPKDSPNAGFKPLGEEEKKDAEDLGNEGGNPSTEEPRINQKRMQVLTALTILILLVQLDAEDDGAEADMTNLDTHIPVSHVPTTRIHKNHPLNQVIRDLQLATQTRTGERYLEGIWVFINKKDERGIMIKNKARLVAQGYTQEEGIDYDEVFAFVARIKAIRLLLAYASFKDFVVYQMDVMSAFLYGKIKEEVYVCQPPGFEDPDFPDRVYKVEKALYGLHQAPRAWYETLSTYLLENRFQRGRIDKTLFIKRDQGDILIVQVYVDDIIFGSTKKKLCTEFEKMMHKKFQMSFMGELTFFLGLQVKQKEDGIFISQDNYMTKILKKFGFSDVKTASTPMETHKPLLKDADGEDIDEHMYRSMIGSLMYLTSSRPDIMFVVCVCAKFQVNPKVSHLHAMKRIFRYLKGQPKLGLWYPKDSPFDLVAYTDSDYAGASLDRKSTTGGIRVNAGDSKLKLLGINLLLPEKVNVARHNLLLLLLQALVDGKKIVVTEASVRRDLQLEDANGVDCLPNATIFEQLTLIGQGKDFSGRVTPLFSTMMVQAQQEQGEGSDMPTITQPSSS